LSEQAMLPAGGMRSLLTKAVPRHRHAECRFSTPSQPFGLTSSKVRKGASLCGNKARFEALVDSAWGEAALES